MYLKDTRSQAKGGWRLKKNNFIHLVEEEKWKPLAIQLSIWFTSSSFIYFNFNFFSFLFFCFLLFVIYLQVFRRRNRDVEMRRWRGNITMKNLRTFSYDWKSHFNRDTVQCSTTSTSPVNFSNSFVIVMGINLCISNAFKLFW